MIAALAIALAVLVPAALVVGYWVGRVESRQFLTAASAVQSVTNETVSRWNQSDAATLAALTSLDQRSKTHGELVAATHRVLSELVLESRETRAGMSPSLSTARQVGEPASWEMTR